jgi:LuxR family maltose regulon positive regulatory protein
VRSVDVPEDAQIAGYTEPPAFMFEAVRTKAFALLAGPSGLASKVVSIVAPTGYGKTVLMSMLFQDQQRAGKHCIWYGLDDSGATLDNLIFALIQLLNGHDASLHSTRTLLDGDEPPERRVNALVDLINSSALPVTLFLDNLHFCTDGVERFLNRLCFSTKASFQLVVSGVYDLPFSAARAHLAGLLRAIGPAELSMSVCEVRQILGENLCHRLGSEVIEQLVHYTEGWPAAARMAQIVLLNSTDPKAALATLSGSDEGLSNLLNREILSVFSPRMREFLLSIGHLKVFCTELCLDIFDDAQAQEYLSELLRRNVFILSLDRNRKWYRFHGLFREFLLHEAERLLSRIQREEILRRASLWCEKNGRWREAIEYALASKSKTVACRILDRFAAVAVHDGDVQQYIRWIEGLHEQQGEVGLDAEYWFVWALVFRRRYDYARQRSIELTDRLKTNCNRSKGSETRELQRRFSMLLISLDCLTDHQEEAHRGALRWLVDKSGGDDPINVVAAHCVIAIYRIAMFQFVEAQRAIQAARQAAFQTGSTYVNGWVAAYAALIPVGEGDYARAYADLIAVIEKCQTALNEPNGMCGMLAFVAAKCAAEMGLDDEARRLLELGIPTSRTHGFLEAMACGLEAATLVWRGPSDEQISIELLREIASAYPPRLSQMLSCFLVRRLISLGRVEEASAEGARIGLADNWDGDSLGSSKQILQLRDLMAVTEASLLIASGRFKKAEAVVVQGMSLAQRERRIARVVDWSLLNAKLAMQRREIGLASRSLTQAIRVAASRRILRAFLPHFEILTALIADSNFKKEAFVLEKERLFFSDLCSRLCGLMPPTPHGLEITNPQPQSVGTVTPRELELLRLIEVGLTNQELADHLDISVTTVKWHLRNVFSKLNVSNRSAALARSRSLNLFA